MTGDYGNGVEWYRGAILGQGSFACVFLAKKKKNPRSKQSSLPALMAVKSSDYNTARSLRMEMYILSDITYCPNIIQYFGNETTFGKDGSMGFNLLLEYASGGTLSDKIKNSDGGKLPELEAKFYAMSILKGLNHIHSLGFVHCDLKPDNILLVPKESEKTEFKAKIADFGLSKKGKQSYKRRLTPYWRGTPNYLAPEVVMYSVQEAPSDIWALGCIVLEMLTGKQTWEKDKRLSTDEILRKIGTEDELPEISNELSKEAIDFLGCCFVRDSTLRYTAQALLGHPFVEGMGDEDVVEVREAQVEQVHEEIKDVFADSDIEIEEVVESGSVDRLYSIEWSDTSDYDNKLNSIKSSGVSYCDDKLQSIGVASETDDRLHSIESVASDRDNKFHSIGWSVSTEEDLCPCFSEEGVEDQTISKSTECSDKSQ